MINLNNSSDLLCGYSITYEIQRGFSVRPDTCGTLLIYLLFNFFILCFLLYLVPTQALLPLHASLMRRFAAVASVCHKKLAVTERRTAKTALMNLAAVSTLG